MDYFQLGWSGQAVGFVVDGIIVVAVFLTLRQTKEDLASAWASEITGANSPTGSGGSAVAGRSRESRTEDTKNGGSNLTLRLEPRR